MDLVKETENKMQAALTHLKDELKTLRTGRANAGMLDKVVIDVYGASMRLTDLATVTVPEARQIIVAPYDQSNLHAICKGIDAANLNVRAIVDGHVVRVKVPEMDQSVRQEMVKTAKRKCEDTKVAIRNCRRDGNEKLKKHKQDGILAEDAVKRGEKQIQDLTDKFCKFADEETQKKEKEILTI